MVRRSSPTHEANAALRISSDSCAAAARACVTGCDGFMPARDAFGVSTDATATACKADRHQLPLAS
ncbi:MAG: hypothetical protein ACLUE1_08035 [Adlercreutzia equolifaciens]